MQNKVCYNIAQNLTDEEKAQARENIGAVSPSEIPAPTSDNWKWYDSRRDANSSNTTKIEQIYCGSTSCTEMTGSILLNITGPISLIPLSFTTSQDPTSVWNANERNVNFSGIWHEEESTAGDEVTTTIVYDKVLVTLPFHWKASTGSNIYSIGIKGQSNTDYSIEQISVGYKE